jgi:restriction endonuclease S subunit
MSAKIFTIQSSEIEGRLDPYYYLPEFRELEEKLENSGFEIHKLKDICEINRGGSPRPIHNFLTEAEDGINWIKIGDTKNIDKYIYQTKEKIKPEGIKHSRLVKSGDFILSNSMSFGKPYIMRTTGCIHDGWLLLRIKDYKKTSEEFLYTLLNTNLIYRLFKRVTIGSVVENLNIDLVKEIKIPLPPMETQDLIVQIMENAYKIKKENEEKAEELLNSIDSYLLEKLEIEIPKEKQEKTFQVNFSDVSGGRFDPFYYKSEFREIEKQLNKCNYLPLGKVTLKITDGSHHSPNNNSSFEKKYITVKDLDHLGNIDLINCNKITKEDFKILEKNGCKPMFGDVLFSKDGTVGKTFTVQEDNDFVVLSSLAILRPDTQLVFPKYLEYILQSEIILSFIKRTMGGSALKRIVLENIKSLQIPLPPLEIQNEIASHIENIRKEAKELQKNGDEVLKNAKIEVEKIILN